ncbi:MAG TPA: hypothetical protein DD490_04945, partial [Acidobacteria bacterium]|nr:hypothetical protein [Acidobacteriota bacterium]
TAFRGAGREAEVLATVRLRVLLHSEMQEGDAALWHYRACDGPGADRLWLKARAALTAAFWFADRGGPGDEAAARRALARGRPPCPPGGGAGGP